jgi:hypothetical protein
MEFVLKCVGEKVGVYVCMHVMFKWKKKLRK